MATIFLIRHGESEANVKEVLSDSLEGYPLTEKGKDEIRRISLQLKGIKFDKIISSPVLRARESADIISKVTGIRIEVDERLRESSMGVYNNKHYFELPEGGREAKGLESWDSISTRMVDFSRNQGGTIIAVSHQITIRVLLAHFLQLGELESYGLDISKGTLSVIDSASGKVSAIGSMRLSERLKSRMGGD